MTPALFTEALAAFAAVCRAVAVWLVVGAGVATAGLLGGIAAAVWPWIAAWERVTEALAAGAALRSLQAAVCGAGKGLAGSGCVDPAPGASDASPGTRDAVDGPSRSHSRCCGARQGFGGAFHTPSSSDAPEKRSAPSWASTEEEAA